MRAGRVAQVRSPQEGNRLAVIPKDNSAPGALPLGQSRGSRTSQTNTDRVSGTRLKAGHASLAQQVEAADSSPVQSQFESGETHKPTQEPR